MAGEVVAEPKIKSEMAEEGKMGSLPIKLNQITIFSVLLPNYNISKELSRIKRFFLKIIF